MKRRGMLLLMVGLIAAGAAALLVYYLSTSAGVQAAPPVAPTATPIPVKPVVLAARDIPAHTMLTAADVITREFPLSLVPADAFAQVGDVISRTALSPVLAGQVVLARQFAASNGSNGVSASLPAGKVLVAFPATDMLNATGAVQPGDHVDILITLPVSGTAGLTPSASAQEIGGGKALVTQATMQDVAVYSTGFWTPQGSPSGSAAGDGLKVITFIVDRQEALILKYIKDSGGTVDLVVRSLADAQPASTEPVSLDYLVNLYRLVAVPTP